MKIHGLSVFYKIMLVGKQNPLKPNQNSMKTLQNGAIRCVKPLTPWDYFLVAMHINLY
jgi:hypothetical protein